MFIDAHCHLSDLPPDELAATLQRAQNNGVSHLMAIGTNVEDSLKTLQLAKAHANIDCALAVHPHDAKLVTDENFAELAQLIRNENKVKAVGEIGLDYHYMNSDKDVQRSVLRRFTKLALEVKKPVIIHDRDCDNECVDILKEEGADKIGGMVHCFSGTQDLANRYLDLGFYVSFTGIITFKKADDLRAVVKNIPLERMLIETDSPFLAPVPFRGKKNEPAFVKHVAECVAQIKGVSLDAVAQITTTNAKSFFALTPNSK